MKLVLLLAVRVVAHMHFIGIAAVTSKRYNLHSFLLGSYVKLDQCMNQNKVKLKLTSMENWVNHQVKCCLHTR